MREEFRPGGPDLMPVAVTSTFGVTIRIEVEAAADYLLHPVFLRFAMICLCIIALLDQSDDVRLLQGWQVAVLWLVVALTCVAVLAAILWGLRVLARGRAGRRVYVPILFLPLVLAGEWVTQGVIGVFRVDYAKPFDLMLVDMARDVLVLMMFDALHALYVAPLHPMVAATEAQGERLPVPVPVPVPVPGTAPEMGPEDSDSDDSRAEPEPVAELEIVRIGERGFALTDLISVRTEDHYLNVVTRSGRSMVRAKLSDIAALHSGRHGVQINRSHWVAFAAITDLREEGNGQIVLDLANGDSATVARTRRLVFLQLYPASARGRV